MPRQRLSACLLFAAACGPGLAQTAAVDFQRDIQPIFKISCVSCHSGAKPAGQRRLDSPQETLRVVVAGKSQESRLIKRVLGQGGEPRMPLAGKPLDDQQVALLKRWIDAGAPGAATETASGPRKHWAYVKPQRPAVPAVKN